MRKKENQQRPQTIKTKNKIHTQELERVNSTEFANYWMNPSVIFVGQLQLIFKYLLRAIECCSNLLGARQSSFPRGPDGRTEEELPLCPWFEAILERCS